VVLTEEEWAEWKLHPTTKYFFKALSKGREFYKEELVRNNVANEDFLKGKAGMIQDILEMSYEDIQELKSEKY